MKFTISSSALLSTLATTGKVVSNKNTLPILDYFLFDLKDGILKVTASDLETKSSGPQYHVAQLHIESSAFTNLLYWY